MKPGARPNLGTLFGPVPWLLLPTTALSSASDPRCRCRSGPIRNSPRPRRRSGLRGSEVRVLPALRPPADRRVAFVAWDDLPPVGRVQRPRKRNARTLRSSCGGERGGAEDGCDRRLGGSKRFPRTRKARRNSLASTGVCPSDILPLPTLPRRHPPVAGTERESSSGTAIRSMNF